LISNKALGRLLVEPKTLGWEHSKKSFENLGVVLTPLKCFQKWFWTKKELGMEEKGVVVFKGKDIGDYVLT
jgi:hypothetical protein